MCCNNLGVSAVLICSLLYSFHLLQLRSVNCFNKDLSIYTVSQKIHVSKVRQVQKIGEVGK